MVDYIFIPSEDIPKELQDTVGRMFNTHMQPRKYIYAFKYRGQIYSGALNHNAITSRGSILEFLKSKPRTSVQELKEFLVLYQLNPNLKNIINTIDLELKP